MLLTLSLDDRRGLSKRLLDLDVPLLWFVSPSEALMAVRKLDDESSLLGLASDASNTGLGIFDRPGDSIRGVVTGDDTALSAARMPDALSGDEESGGAKLPTETLLWRIDLAGCCALSCEERRSLSYSKENLRA